MRSGGAIGALGVALGAAVAAGWVAAHAVRASGMGSVMVLLLLYLFVPTVLGFVMKRWAWVTSVAFCVATALWSGWLREQSRFADGDWSIPLGMAGVGVGFGCLALVGVLVRRGEAPEQAR